MPPILSDNLLEEITKHLYSVFSDYIDDRTRPLLEAAIQEEHRLGVSPTSNERIRAKAQRYFASVMAEYRDMKKERTKLKQKPEFDPQVQVLQRKVKRLASQCEGLKMALMGAMIMIFSNYSQCKVLLSGSADKLLEQHRAEEEKIKMGAPPGKSADVIERKVVFGDVDEEEKMSMVRWRNYVRIGMVLFKPYRNQTTLFRIATRLEGKVAEYITGGGASLPTLRRYAIYKRQERIFGAQRSTSKWRGTLRKIQVTKLFQKEHKSIRHLHDVHNGMQMLGAAATVELSSAPDGSGITTEHDNHSSKIPWDVTEGAELVDNDLDDGEMAFNRNPDLVSEFFE